MQDTQDDLSGDEFIGDEPYDEWGDDCTDGLGEICNANLCTGGMQVGEQEGSHRYEPGSPDEELEEHHGGQLHSGS